MSHYREHKKITNYLCIEAILDLQLITIYFKDIFCIVRILILMFYIHRSHLLAIYKIIQNLGNAWIM